MRLSERIGRHVRANVVGYVALFLALSAGAYAAAIAPKNSVVSKSIKNGQVKNADIAANAVDSSKIADNSITGADVDESSLGQVSASNATHADSASNADQLGGSPASDFIKGADSIPGGDLGGTYASPQIKDGSIGTSKIGSIPTAGLTSAIYNVDAGDIDCKGGANSAFPNNHADDIDFAFVQFGDHSLASQPNPSNANCFNGFTVQQTGTYLVTATVAWASDGAAITAPTSRKINIYALNPNASCCALFTNTEGPSNVSPGNHETRQSTSGIAHLQAGTFVGLAGEQTSGAPLNLTAGGGNMQIAWLGP